MKTTICVCAMVAFILMGSIPGKAEDFYSDETLNNTMKRLVQISGENIALIKSGGNPDDVIAKADELHALASGDTPSM